MSLLDAMLLEPYRDPREIWIALRKDGVRGSGTLNDPYDGSTRDYVAQGVSLTRIGSVATAITAGDHKFVSGDAVTISGVATGNDADRFYTGTFLVTVVNSTTFTYQMLGTPALSPAAGSATCVRERELFDGIMRSAPANSLIHVGPGVFESKGTASGIIAWEPKSGQRIKGSGVGVTTLKLVKAAWPELNYSIIAPGFYASYIEDFEISDINFDCNIAGQPIQQVSCTAVWIYGSHVRLRRLRAINFSSQTVSYVENFVFGVGASHPDSGKQGVNSVIEDCVAENPGLNAANNSSVFITFAGERPTDGIMGYHRAFAIRRCWYDGTLKDRPVSISSITINAATGVATVTTRVKHNRDDGAWVVISGATVGGSATAYNGSYPISNRSDYQFDYTPVAYGGLLVPSGPATGEMWVDQWSSLPIPIKTLAVDPLDSTAAILTTHGPHNRKPLQWARILPQRILPPGTGAFFGRFPIISIDSPVQLKYRMANPPSTSPVPDLVDVLGVFGAGVTVDGGSEAVAEGNHVFNTHTAGPYHDTYSTKDFVARDNYYSDVFAGPSQNLTAISDLKTGSSLTYQNISGQWIATMTTQVPHGLAANDTIKVRGAVTLVSGAYSYGNPYNGDSFSLLSSPAPTSTSFSYALPSDPGMNSAGSPIYFKTQDPDPVKTGTVTSPQSLIAEFTTSTPHTFQVGDIVSVFGVTVGGSFSNVYNRVAKIETTTSTTKFTYKLLSAPQGTVAGTPSCALAVATPLVVNATTATFRTVFPHGFVVGQGVRIEDVDPLVVAGNFVGNFNVATVISSTTFTVTLPTAPSTNARPGAVFAALWQVGLHVLENNIVELAQPSPPGFDYYGNASAINSARMFWPPRHTFRQVVIRNNLIRNLPSYLSGVFYGITLDGAENALVESNLVDLPQTSPIFHKNSKSVGYFGNLASSGKLLQGRAEFEGPKVDELATRIEDALLLSI